MVGLDLLLTCGLGGYYSVVVVSITSVCPRSGLVDVGLSAIILCHDQSPHFVIIHLVRRQKKL